MPFSPADFEKGIDFTALGPAATAGSHNTLVDNATPYIDVVTQSGKAIILWSVDIALNVPDVPDASTTTKWKNYIWMRVPYVIASSRTPVLYVWDEGATNDPTYRKWVVFNDLTAIHALIDALEVDISGILAIANNALAAANAANALSGQALAAAQAAEATATAANTLATEAKADSVAAITLAGVADNKSDNAVATANNALAATAYIPRYYPAQTNATFNINDHIAYDNTAPASNEGVEILTLTFTPRAIGNRIMVRASAIASVDTDVNAVIALFKNDDASASAVGVLVETTENGSNALSIDYYFLSTSTNPITLRLRAGAASGTMVINEAKYGGTQWVYLQAIEVPPVT